MRKKTRKTKIVYEYTKQKGRSNRKIDSRKKALAPGKRISKNGKVYYERRKNRSDLPHKRV